VELRDGAIHGGPTLARSINDFSGRINISFTHASTIKNSLSNIVFNSSLGPLSDVAPCLVLDSVERTSRSLDW